MRGVPRELPRQSVEIVHDIRRAELLHLLESVTQRWRRKVVTAGRPSPTPRVGGVKYWLACHTDVSVNSRGSDGTNQSDARRLISHSYDGGLPDLFGSGGSNPSSPPGSRTSPTRSLS
jgi:hypothetical protein